MKLILALAFLALVCMVRTAPTSSSTTRKLILPDYDEDWSHDTEQSIEQDTVTDVQHGDTEEEEEEEKSTSTTTTATTTTATRTRSTFKFPTRDRDLMPTRRYIPPWRTSSIQVVTIDYFNDMDGLDGTDEYDGDFKYIRNIRKFIQKMVEKFRQMIRKITGYGYVNSSQQEKQDRDY